MAFLTIEERFLSVVDEIRDTLEMHADIVEYSPAYLKENISIIIDRISPPARREPKYKKKKIGPKLRLAVYKRDGYCCVICCLSEDLSLDHIIPESKGGASTIDNLQTLCRHCNAVKGTSV